MESKKNEKEKDIGNNTKSNQEQFLPRQAILKKIDENILYKAQILPLQQKCLALQKSIASRYEEYNGQDEEYKGLQLRYLRDKTDPKFYAATEAISGTSREEMVEKMERFSSLLILDWEGMKNSLSKIEAELNETGIREIMEKALNSPTKLDMIELEKAENRLYEIEGKIEEFKTNVLDENAKKVQEFRKLLDEQIGGAN